MKQNSLIIVISAPSGAGKTTICREFQKSHPRIHFSISATTRPPRPGEKEGIDYFFLKQEEFQKKVSQNELLEWAEVHGNRYGTLRSFVEKRLAEEKDLFLEIDVQGGLQVKKKYPERTVLIFLKPSSERELKVRLEKRRTETEKTIKNRLSRAQKEMKSAEEYDYLIINDQLSEALKELNSIIVAEKCKIKKKRS
jgi:guanylate kinase